MMELFGGSGPALPNQLLLGLVNGAYYAMLSLGLAVIFGLVNIINLTHGAQYLLATFVAWFVLSYLGLGYWWALALALVAVGIGGIIVERTSLLRAYQLNHLYGLMLTFGLMLVVKELATGGSGSPHPSMVPVEEPGSGAGLGFLLLPAYRGWIVVAAAAACIGAWYVVERTRLGARLRAATRSLTGTGSKALPRTLTLTYGFGVALAAFAGILAAPMYEVDPLLGTELVIVVFAVVAIGGMGSISGSIITGFGLGIVEGVTKLLHPEASSAVIFLLIALVLLLRPGRPFDRTGFPSP